MRPPSLFNRLDHISPEHRRPVGRSVGSFCSRFELPYRAFCQRRIAIQVVRIKDRMHVLQAMPGQGGDLGVRAAGKRQPRDRRKAASTRARTAAMMVVPRTCPAISTTLRQSAIHAVDHLPDSELES